MNLQICCTEKGVKTYPLHKHQNHEIMLYLEGSGDYLFSLCSTYIYFLLQHMQKQDHLSIAINKIIAEITANKTTKCLY